MTLFTEGRLQAFERMMQDTGKYKDSKLCVGCPAIYLAH